MPIITLNILIEKDNPNEEYKHYLNHEDFEVFSAKEDKNTFAMAVKKSKIELNKKQ